MLKKFSFVFFFLLCLWLNAQETDPYENTQISILTIGPGYSLNDAFGHNGIRVKTSFNDVVYDYGRYPFNDPNFYLNFARGKLIYSQGMSNYRDVIGFYKGQKRSIQEQVLNLTNVQKRALHVYLIDNSLPENRDYLYDFFYDNCATKIRDVIEEITNNDIVYHPVTSIDNSTFRDLIHENLNWNSWGSLGIDIALGSVVDIKASAREHMFLPEYVYASFQGATLKSSGEAIVDQFNTINSDDRNSIKTHFLLSPIYILGSIALLILLITYRDHKNNTRSRWLDVTIFLVTGIAGTSLLLLWLATDHTTTANNYNLLWAFALNLIFVFHISRKKPASWVVKYIKFLIILLILLSLHWIVGVQRFAWALMPLLIALLIRYLFLTTFLTNLLTSEKYHRT